MVLFSFLFFLIGIVCLVGFIASKKSRGSEDDYFLGSQSISPYALALSSSASKFSGFMFSGFMGLAYGDGTAVIWFGSGSLIGAFLVYAFIIKNLQEMNTGGWALSLAELITFWHGENLLWLRRFIGLSTVFFLSIYAAAQLKAGGKALEVALEQPLHTGILLSTVVIIFYCWAGGIRASIWTDTVQVIIMTISLILILIIAIGKEGGLSLFISSFMETGSDPNHVAFIPQNLSIGGYSGWLLFFLGATSLGVCCLGQPHILIRGMVLKNSKDVKKFIITNYVFETFFVILFILVGLSTRVILKGSDFFDPELALFLSANEILPPVAVGFVLAGVFSSTLSTADSQIISCSASFMRDFTDPPKQSLFMAKVGTISIALFVTVIALFSGESVFALVVFAYSGLGASIGSILILRIFNVRLPEWGLLLIAISSGITVVLWSLSGLKDYVSESIPGFIVAFLIYICLKATMKGEKKQLNNPF